MLCFPGHGIIYIDQAGGDAGNGHLAGLLHGNFMQTDIAAEIKYPIYRCCNECGKMNRGHIREIEV